MPRIFKVYPEIDINYRVVGETFDTWTNRYGLERNVYTDCDSCGASLHYNKPVFFKGWRGLEQEDCKCGENTPSVYYEIFNGY